jgi:hypothetical protein
MFVFVQSSHPCVNLTLNIHQAASKTTSTNPQWVIHPKAYDKLVLVALYHVGDDVWQADVAIDL